MNPTTSIETITPALAREMLKVNVSNRRLRPWKINAYAALMTKGVWVITGESLLFDVRGNLMNGQHRLLACIKANVSFVTTVLRGAPPEAYDYVDSGMKRTMADVLAHQDIPHAISCAAAARLVLAYHAGLIGNNREVSLLADRPTVLAEVQEDDDLYQKYATMASNRRANSVFMPSAMLAFCVIASQVNGIGTIDGFIDNLLSGAGLEVGDPRLALGRLMRGPSRPSSAEKQLSGLIRAYRPWLEGEPLKIVRPWVPGEPFPVIPTLEGV